MLICQHISVNWNKRELVSCFLPKSGCFQRREARRWGEGELEGLQNPRRFNPSERGLGGHLTQHRLFTYEETEAQSDVTFPKSWSKLAAGSRLERYSHNHMPCFEENTVALRFGL